MLRKTRRYGAKKSASKRGKRASAKRERGGTVPGPSQMVLASDLPARPKGYLTYQKGTKLIAKKMNRKGGKRGRKVCRK